MVRRQHNEYREFSDYILQRRQDLGISLLELERRTGLHNSRLSRWERGIDMPDRPERLASLARGLEVQPADLYVLAGVELIDQLPSHRLYLRSTYKQLPHEAVREITAYAEDVIRRYGDHVGPADGEDEQAA